MRGKVPEDDEFQRLSERMREMIWFIILEKKIILEILKFCIFVIF